MNGTARLQWRLRERIFRIFDLSQLCHYFIAQWSQGQDTTIEEWLDFIRRCVIHAESLNKPLLGAFDKFQVRSAVSHRLLFQPQSDSTCRIRTATLGFE